MSKKQGLEKPIRIADQAVQPTVVLSATDEAQDCGPVESVESVESARFPFRSHALAFIAIVLFLLSVGAVSLFQQRSAQESQFREYLDEAQLIDLENKANFAEAENPYWKKALGLAIQLGDSKNVLADLYQRASAEEGPGESGRLNERADLENALRLYSQIPNSDSQLIKTINSLVFVLVPPLRQFDDGQISLVDPDCLRKIDAFLKDNQLPQALSLCKTYVTTTHGSEQLARRLRIIAHRLKVNDPLIPTALPVFEDCVYFYSDDIVELHNEQIALNEVLRKGGFQTDSYASLRKLKDEALAAKDYHGAFIYLQRGLGDHHDEALRTELVKVRQSIKESDDHIAMADVKEAKDKLQALQALQTKCFGEGSYHLVSTDRKIAYLDALLGNSSTAVRLLEQRIAKLPDRP